MLPTRKFIRVMKFLIASVTLFCGSWIASVNKWHAGVHSVEKRSNSARVDGVSTMRTIVAYSEGKLAEMDRPSPVACDRLPAFPKIPQINHTWSPHSYTDTWQNVDGTPVSLYSAYYDARAPQRFVRILAIFHGRNISEAAPLFCQTRSLKSSQKSIEVVAAKPLEIWWHEWDPSSSTVETPLLLSCPLTDDLYDASVVSVVNKPCDDPTNGFILKPKKVSEYNRIFTICVKDMHFNNDIAEHLVEWIEVNKILGVDLIDFYIDEISKGTINVLLNYKQRGYVRLFHVPIKYKLNRSLWQRRRDHLISYNDCLYRNLAESEYVIPLDVDEILMPKIAFNLPDLLIRLRPYGWNLKEYSAILIQNVFFFDFKQKEHKYEFKESNSTNSKIYVKRDDVRIKGAMDFYYNKKDLEKKKNHPYNLSTRKILDLNNGSKMDIKHRNYNCEKTVPVPKLSKHIIRSALVSPVGYYSKSMMLTRRVLTAFNHYPLANLGMASFAGWSAPFSEVQLNHYKESCNTTMVTECAKYKRRVRIDRTALRLHPKVTHALRTALCQQIKSI